MGRNPVFAQIHRANSWQWKPATVTERIGKVNHNVFIEERQQLIRAPERCTAPANQPTPLSIFFDGFVLTIPTEFPSHLKIKHHSQRFDEALSEDPYLTENLSEDEAVGNEEEDEELPVEPIKPVTSDTDPREGRRHMIHLPLFLV